MSLNQNQFVEIPIKGQIDLNFNNMLLSCIVDSTAAADLVPGQAVVMVDSAGGVPKVKEIAANSDDIFGFVAYTQKDQSFPVGAKVEICFFRGAVMIMEALSAISRNAQLAVVISGNKVAEIDSGQTIIGRALDSAAADGDLIRVLIDLPGVQAD